MTHLLLVLALFTASAGARQATPSVDEIVSRNIEAKGGLARLRNVQTVKQVASLSVSGMQATMTIYGKRPNLLRQEFNMGGQMVINAFDGETPWMVNPLSGMARPVVITGPHAELIREQSSAFDGPLVGYKDRGGTLDLIGTETVGGRKMHHLKLTSKSGQVQQCYIDAETMLEARVVSESEAGRFEQELSDYREVEGIKIPFLIRSLVNGVQQNEIKLEKVEFNAPIDDALFRMPKGQ